MRRALGLTVAAWLALALAVSPAWAQRAEVEHPIFGHSQFSGTGFIETPHAMVPPGTLYGTFSMVIPQNVEGEELWTQHNGTVGLTVGRFIEVGVSMNNWDSYSGFAKVQVLRQTGKYPALAFGVTSVNTTERARYTLSDWFYAEDNEAEELVETASFYGVATYVVGPGRATSPSWIVFSGGYGFGPIFSKDNPLFLDEGSSGFFGAVAFDFLVGDGAFLRVVGEYDGFDANAGIVVWLDGLEATLGVVAIDETDPPETPPPGPVLANADAERNRRHAWYFYNQSKLFFTVALEARALAHLPFIWNTGEE
jgi:hypothetical protein